MCVDTLSLDTDSEHCVYRLIKISRQIHSIFSQQVSYLIVESNYWKLNFSY